MPTLELRDAAQARRLVLDGLWLSRAAPPSPAGVRAALAVALDLLAAGHPLPPTGFVADCWHLAVGTPADARPAAAPGWDAGQVRLYEDHVLGKLYAEVSFERAADALRGYPERDRTKGVAYVVERLRARANFDGTLFSPAIVKAMREEPPEALLAEARDRLLADGPDPRLVEQLTTLCKAARAAAAALGPEDLFELDTRTAIAELAQSVALRQVVRTAGQLLDATAAHRPRQTADRREVPTRAHEEDQYPVGGFSSLATKGSVESLLHTQLALMERDERPDLFDIKFVRDELLYYSRDENTFLRRRRTVAFVFEPDLAQARYKDAELPVQRVVLALAFCVAAVRRLADWLSSEALQFVLLFPGDGVALAGERGLLELVLREAVAAGAVRVVPSASPAQVQQALADAARRSVCDAVAVGVAPTALDIDGVAVGTLAVAGPRPTLTLAGAGEDEPADDAVEAWQRAFGRFVAAVA